MGSSSVGGELHESQVDFACVVEVDERVQFGYWHAGEAAAHRSPHPRSRAGMGTVIIVAAAIAWR
jgi:hypothetical protein